MAFKFIYFTGFLRLTSILNAVVARIIPLFLFLFIYITLPCATIQASPSTAATRGVLDLRQSKFLETGSVTLRGEWFCGAYSLLNEPEAQAERPEKFITLPGMLQGACFPSNQNQPAVISLKLLLARPGHYVFYLPRRSYDYSLWVNEVKIHRSSDSKSPAFTDPTSRNQNNALQTIELKESNIITVRLNNSKILGQDIFYIRLGSIYHLGQELVQKSYLISFVIGAYFFMGIYHLILWIFRRLENRFFWFGLLALALSLRVLVSSPPRIDIFHGLSNLAIVEKFDIISLILLVPILVYFIFHFANILFSERIPVLIAGFSVLLAIIVAFLPGDTLAFIPPIFGGLFFLFSLQVLFRFKKQFSSLDLLQKIGILAFFLLAPAFLYDLLNIWNSSILPHPLFSGSLFLFMVLHAALIGKNLSSAFNSLDYLHVNLQNEVEKRTKELKTTNDILKRISSLDGLTGIANRRCFDENLDREWKRACRSSTPICLILLDIDYFKKYNDIYGHLEGDNCLIKVTQALGENIRRPADLLARYGGEEFAVLLPETDIHGGEMIAASMQKSVEKYALHHDGSEISSVVTISLGVAELLPHASNSGRDLIEYADRALYAAKAAGRNQVSTYHAGMETV